ncbi:MAG: MBL fold metallo-hydrolase [Martelella sp.]|uniref:MBL fold metallo-hydrolase n=1 Tax=Martelella sp. TaxID=1969699 RepID=UPI0032425E8A
MKITLLGTGTPAPSLTRQSSGLAVEIGNDLLVFDHGPGAHHRLLEAGYKAADVSHFFMTHYHYDHLMDYPRLLLTRWDHAAPGHPELKVFGPSPLIEITERIIGKNGLFALDLAARINSPASQAVYRARGGKGDRPGPKPELRELGEGEIIEGKGWRIRTGPARHVQPYLNSISYRIETEAGTLVYAGDNGGVYEPMIAFAKDADMLIAMNHFLSGTEQSDDYRRMSGSHIDNAVTAARANVGTLVLTHFLPSLCEPGLQEKMVCEMSAHFSGPIITGEDLMRLPIRPKDPASPD